jgi:predicted dehydrogenase
MARSPARQVLRKMFGANWIRQVIHNSGLIADRRAFLKAVAAQSLVAFPVMAETVTNGLRNVAGLRLGLIGLGHRGQFLLERFQKLCQVTAICDVHKGRLESTAAKNPRDIQRFTDYRPLLDSKSLTGVVIATPDHWHARIMLDALQAGKHVFCETPVCRTLAEAAVLTRTANNAPKLKVQVGCQGRANAAAFAACRYVREGRIGRPQTVRLWSDPDPVFKPATESENAPAQLNWPFWLGPLISRPYDERLFAGEWRFVDEIGGGYLMSRDSQLLVLLQWFLGHELMGRIEVKPDQSMAALHPPKAGHEVKLTFDFLNSGLRCQWETGQAADRESTWGLQCKGDRGELTLLGGDETCRIKQEVFGYKSSRPFNDPAWDFAPDHRLNWLQCIVGQDTPTVPIKPATQAAAICIAGLLARRLNRKLVWDFDTHEFVADPEANRLREAADEGNEWTVRI